MAHYQFDPFAHRPKEQCTAAALRAESPDVDVVTRVGPAGRRARPRELEPHRQRRPLGPAATAAPPRHTDRVPGGGPRAGHRGRTMHRRPTDPAGRRPTTDPRRRGLRALIVALTLVTAMVAMAMPSGAAPRSPTRDQRRRRLTPPRPPRQDDPGADLLDVRDHHDRGARRRRRPRHDGAHHRHDGRHRRPRPRPSADPGATPAAVAVPAAATITVTPVDAAGAGRHRHRQPARATRPTPSSASSSARCRRRASPTATSRRSSYTQHQRLRQLLDVVHPAPHPHRRRHPDRLLRRGRLQDRRRLGGRADHQRRLPDPVRPEHPAAPAAHPLGDPVDEPAQRPDRRRDRHELPGEHDGRPARVPRPPDHRPVQLRLEHRAVHGVRLVREHLVSPTPCDGCCGPTAPPPTARPPVRASCSRACRRSATAPPRRSPSTAASRCPRPRASPSPRTPTCSTVTPSPSPARASSPNYPVSVSQCPAGASQGPGCGFGPGSFVETDDTGAFSFDLVVDRILYDATTSVDCADPGACVVAVIDFFDGSMATSAPIQFDPNAPLPPPPSVSIDPATGVDDGQLIRVFGSGFPRRTNVGVVQCRVNAGGPGGCDLSTLELRLHRRLRRTSPPPCGPSGSSPPTPGSIDCAIPGACVVGAGVAPNGNPSANTPILFRTGVPGPDVERRGPGGRDPQLHRLSRTPPTRALTRRCRPLGRHRSSFWVWSLRGGRDAPAPAWSTSGPRSATARSAAPPGRRPRPAG